jgi:integrase
MRCSTWRRTPACVARSWPGSAGRTLTLVVLACTSGSRKWTMRWTRQRPRNRTARFRSISGTVTVLRNWRKAQLAERLAWGLAWTDTGRVLTREDGMPLLPGWISQRFTALAGRAKLPPIRLHDLRHGAA